MTSTSTGMEIRQAIYSRQSKKIIVSHYCPSFIEAKSITKIYEPCRKKRYNLHIHRCDIIFGNDETHIPSIYESESDKGTSFRKTHANVLSTNRTAEYLIRFKRATNILNRLFPTSTQLDSQEWTRRTRNTILVASMRNGWMTTWRIWASTRLRTLHHSATRNRGIVNGETTATNELEKTLISLIEHEKKR